MIVHNNILIIRLIEALKEFKYTFKGIMGVDGLSAVLYEVKKR